MAATPFSRLVALCGLTQQEAADYLGIAKKTVAMKAIGQRRTTLEEMTRLATLWSEVKAGRPPASAPAGAHERSTALVEVAALLRAQRRRERTKSKPVPIWAPF